jgi:parallel beta-helix repeat protein
MNIRIFTRKLIGLLVLWGVLLTPIAGVIEPQQTWLAAPLYAAPGVDAVYTVVKDDRAQPTIQVIGEGAVVTLPDVKNGLGAANVNHVVDLGNGKWRLNANLSIDVGVTLNLSPATGVSELQLRSDSNGLVQAAEAEASINYKTFVYLRALNGTINIDSVKIYSWDPAANAVDTNYNNGRAYILAKYASTMRIRNSDIGYLGSSDGESYGLSWRDQNLNENEPFVTRVTGELIDSDIHHNYYGIYTYQARDMVFRGNKFHHNVLYGFDPHDYSHHILVENNVAYENGAHGFIISRGCEYFTFRNNISYNNFNPGSNQAHGFMLDPGGLGVDKPQVSSSFNILENNEAYGNEGHGLRVLGSRDNIIRNNNFHHNYMGISLDLDSENNEVYGNQFNQNTQFGIHLRETSRANKITNNTADANGQYGIYLRSNDNIVTGNTLRQNLRAGIAVIPISSSKLPINNQVTGNTITGNTGDGLYIEQAQKNRFEDNLIADNTANGVELVKDAKQNTLLRNTIRNNVGDLWQSGRWDHAAARGQWQPGRPRFDFGHGWSGQGGGQSQRHCGDLH